MQSRFAHFVIAGVVWAVAGSLPARAADVAARLDAPSVPASETASTLLHVLVPGRFTLAAHSASGASLQLVDMLAGPGDVAGTPGAADGRLDLLLDAGTYKLRVVSAAHASGWVTLSATPFVDAAPVAVVAPPGELSTAELADRQQRRFWLVVPPDGRMRVSATGRALADLRLWRDGRDLVPLLPTARNVEPVHGHPLTELVLQGRVEPGTYQIAAYGGPAVTWGDGARAMPFSLRSGASPALSAGWAAGSIAATGNEVFTLPKWAASLRLELPALAANATETSLVVGDGPPAVIEGRNREAWTVLRLPDKHPDQVELRGAAGQPYRVRVIARLGPPEFATPGNWWVSADTLGLGGDDVPPGLLLLRNESDRPTRILGSTVPRVGAGAAWRARFNLRGPTRLLVNAEKGGELAISSSGVALDRKVDPRSYYDLAPDMMLLSLMPASGSFGALDLTFGPPGLRGALSVPFPADPVISFGLQSLAPGQSFELVGPQAPGVEFGLSARQSPVALADAPLMTTQLPGHALSVAVKLPAHAALQASVVGEKGALALTGTQTRRDGSLLVTVPASPAFRTVVLAVAPTVDIPPPPKPRPAASLARIDAGRPAFFDLEQDASRSFALHVAHGGLYQVETLGRLRTAGNLGTSFIAEVASGTANGAGQNMQLLPWLREGDYRVTVTARDSAGHLGLRAIPAPLLPGTNLLPDASIRATMAEGMGLEVPIEVPAAGKYRISLQGQGNVAFSARIDDASGWPLLKPGPFAAEELSLQAGRYRLLVTPGTTARRVVATMQRIVPPRVIAGHGPHRLAFGETLTATWHEPPVGGERVPDAYMFDLDGPAHAHVKLGAGMAATLVETGHEPKGGAGDEPIRVGEHWDGVLGAGHWRLEARAQGRDDRLGYTIALSADELQPGQPTDAALPSTQHFSIAAERVVTLATSGAAPVRAVLRDAAGVVLVRAGARDDDWNVALSRRLQAGTYTLDLSPGGPPPSVAVAADARHAARQEAQAENDANEGGQPSADAPAAEPDAGDATQADAAPSDATQADAAPSDATQADAAPSDATQADAGPSDAVQADGTVTDPGPADAADSPTTSDRGDQTDQAEQTTHGSEGDASRSESDASASDNQGAASARTSVTLGLPADLPAMPAPESQTALPGLGVHVLAVPAPPPGALLVASAKGAGAIVLALERQDAAGSWRQVAQNTGAAPFVAALADDGTGQGGNGQGGNGQGGHAPWRVALWSMDGGAAPISAAVRAVTSAPADRSEMLQGMDVAVARIVLSAPAVTRISGPPGLLQASWPGHAAIPLDLLQAVPQGSTLWLVGPVAGPVATAPMAKSGGLTLDIPAGARAVLPTTPAPAGRIRVWRADSGDGQPGWIGADTGAAMGADAPNSAVLLAEATSPALEQAGPGDEPMRVQVTPFDLVSLPVRQMSGPLSVRLGHGQALPVHVATTGGDLSISLTAGMAAFIEGPTGKRGVWAPIAPVSRVVSAGSAILLANLGAGFGYAGISPRPHAGPKLLAPGQVLAGFHGAAGSFDMPADMPAGGMLAVAGDASLLVRDGAGRVLTGTSLHPAPGRAQVTMTHGAGAALLWLEAPGRSPWPDPVTAPMPAGGTLALQGPAMAVQVAAAGPILVHATTTAPVLLGIGGDAPELFQAGAELHRALPGAATLRILPAQDGALSGTLSVWTETLRPAPEGLGLTVVVPPGGSAAFAFTLAHRTRIGVGVRAEPDGAAVRLLDGAGHLVGEGVAQLRDLKEGSYVIEARVPPTAPATTIRPALLGTVKRGSGPPADIAAGYLSLVGLKPNASSR